MHPVVLIHLIQSTFGYFGVSVWLLGVKIFFIWRYPYLSYFHMKISCYLGAYLPRRFADKQYRPTWKYFGSAESKTNVSKISCVSLYLVHILCYRKVSNTRRTLAGNKIVDHSDVIGASPVGAAPTTSHSQLSAWLQWIGQRQLQDETRKIYVWGLGALILENWRYISM